MVLPEYVLTGFPAERMRALAEPLDGPSLDAFRRHGRLGRRVPCRQPGASGGTRRGRAAAPDARGPAGRGAAPGEPPVFDTTVVVAPDGELLTVYDKTHLFDREQTVFTPGAALEPPFAWRGVRFGVLCCFDIELPEPARTLALRGARCLLVPSANMEP